MTRYGRSRVSLTMLLFPIESTIKIMLDFKSKFKQNTINNFEIPDRNVIFKQYISKIYETLQHA